MDFLFHHFTLQCIIFCSKILQIFNFRMLLLLCPDMAQCGRFNPSMLSDHHMVELFFIPMDYDESRKELGGDEDDTCTWDGIQCSPAKRVERIDWYVLHVETTGEVNFRMLPPLLERLMLRYQALTGEVDTSNLPPQMKQIYIHSCDLSGTLHLGNLPQTLEDLRFSSTSISSIVRFSNLPESLETVQIDAGNVVDEDLRIGKLPLGKIHISIEDCAFQRIIFEDGNDTQRVRIVEK